MRGHNAHKKVNILLNGIKNRSKSIIYWMTIEEKSKRKREREKKSDLIAYHLHSNASNQSVSSNYCGFRFAQITFNRNQFDAKEYFAIQSIFFFSWFGFYFFGNSDYRIVKLNLSPLFFYMHTVPLFFLFFFLSRYVCDVRTLVVSHSEIIIECVRSIRKKKNDVIA